MLLQRIANRGIRLGTLFDRAARRHPGSPVITDHTLDVAPELGTRFTVTEVAELVADLASRLWAARVRPGDHVVVYKSDGFDISLLACAIARTGAIPVLLSPKLDGATVGVLLRRVDRPYLVTDQAKLDTELGDVAFADTTAVLLASGEHPSATTLASLAGSPRVAAVSMPPSHPTLITHTSGTTGVPKLAVHTGHTMQSRYRPQASVVSLVGKREPIAVHVSFVHSRMFTAMPISVLQGHPLVVLRDDDPAVVAELFLRVPPGLIEAHPNTFLRWEVLAEDPRGPLAGVKYFSSTFDAIHPRTVHRLLGASRRKGALFAQAYGQSEVGPIAARTYGRKRGTEADGRCVGRPFPGMTGVRVVSRDGKPPTKDSPGFIEVRSDGRVVTYLGEHQRWAKQVSDGWWRMGDLGYRTKWGCLHLLDREVDAIAGIGSTLEIEDKLFARLPDLVEVIIVPDADGKAVPVVCTRDNKVLDQEQWRAAVATLPPLRPPVQWRLEDLPQTATTKIKRLELGRLLTSPRDL
ncbi:class I adenylate-forming enzyme family protein [Actinokineospora globicatena]|uniref:Fatty-acid-CoA ligase FadD n=1 Tax=Actinokineospora globicatena TaxID=103729 RepID=A0A9W6V8U0_9PSEU|nr:AMP-binding protein [Actinokineospora globicatena]MCP2303166.1 Acyl-coenzyme A synthetase/AMP-(fatty) acid ligase [Actinokineospora globicatena]GLW79717.1 putative fatty-acid-CoA ligase FadD [Actinokineospora globicatena]GLW85873.1 putative fatty-acid-CoA ligase FadD [Actinokineospora globicatena]GLW90321.1 putative fatty-acid-CoA ligase FadD [Actinokineospora globicatena]